MRKRRTTRLRPSTEFRCDFGVIGITRLDVIPITGGALARGKKEASHDNFGDLSESLLSFYDPFDGLISSN